MPLCYISCWIKLYKLVMNWSHIRRIIYRLVKLNSMSRMMASMKFHNFDNSAEEMSGC